MSSTSTFGSFTTARLGIYSSSKWLDVIGNNISNVNTEGYTRQSVDQISLYMGGADKYRSGLDVRVGNGGLVTKVTQLRDPYMDIRYRSEISSVGAMDAKLNGLQQISNILDEVAYGEDEDGNLGVVELQFNHLISQVQRLVDQGAGDDTFDTNVRTSAASLCSMFNSYASRLEELRQNQETGLSDDITKVNELLTNIRDLSDSIRKANIYGGDALEQKDARNLLIDELAEYIRIDVKYEIEDLGPGQQVEKLVISLNGDDVNDTSTNKMKLVDGIYCTQLSIDHPVLAYENGIPKVTAAGKPYYLDEEGLVTDDIYKAAREYNDQYNVVLSTLRDRWNRTEDVPYEQENKMVATATDEAAANDEAAALAKSDPTGIIDGRAYKFEYTVEAIKDKNGTVTGYGVMRHASFTSQQLTDNTLYGSIQSQRELLTEQGEYCTAEQLESDYNASSKRGIVYYQKALDTLANQFAAIMNEANTVRGGHLIETEDEALSKENVYPGDYFLTQDASGNDIYVTLQTEDGYLKTGTTCNLEGVTFAGTTKAKKVAQLEGLGIDRTVLAELGYDKYDGLIADLEKDPDLLLKLNSDGTLTSLQKKHLLPTGLGGLDHGSYETVELPDNYEEPNDGPLFSNHGSRDTTGVPYDPNDPDTAKNPPITAATISISKSWGEGVVRIQQSTDPLHPSTDNSNLYHILNLLQESEHEFRPMGADLDGGEQYSDPANRPGSNTVTFRGTFQKMFSDNICGHLANDFDSTNTMLNNYTTAADELYVDRDSVMGVDLNDEAMNMMQVQKSLTAAYRLMTVIDDMLDRLINGTGRAGL